VCKFAAERTEPTVIYSILVMTFRASRVRDTLASFCTSEMPLNEMIQIQRRLIPDVLLRLAADRDRHEAWVDYMAERQL
jgi:hypothetical protein